MNQTSRRDGVHRHLINLIAAAGVFISPGITAADFTVTSPGFFFSINGSANPTLTLERGKTYSFAVSTTPNFHPFHIDSPGVSNNDIFSGTITYTVPNVASNYIYFCTVHGLLMSGTILTVAPPPPPTIQILSLSLGQNLVLTSTGTTNWSVLPEFNTNLATTNWFALTVQSNRFSNGTNETFCGRPPGENVFFRIKSSPLPN